MNIVKAISQIVLLSVLVMTLTSCSAFTPGPTAIPPSTITPAATITAILLPTYTPVPTCTPTLTPTLEPTPEPTEAKELGFELPPECSVLDPSISKYFYADISHGACDNPVLSPDGAYLAYGYVTKPNADHPKGFVQERLFSTSSFQSFPIYEAKCIFLHPVWAPPGYLVIYDVPYDFGCGYTAIYDQTKDEIVAILDGDDRWGENWSGDQNALFTISPTDFGPVCAETLSGFDFIAGKPAPTIKPITPGTDLYVVIGAPMWSSDNKTLFAKIRDGTCSDERNQKCTYHNSYIVTIHFNGTNPTISHPYYDPSIDYSMEKSEDGRIIVNTNPAKTVTCIEADLEEWDPISP